MLGHFKHIESDLNHHVRSSFSNQLISFVGMKYWKSAGDCSEILNSGTAEYFPLSSISLFVLKLQCKVKH